MGLIHIFVLFIRGILRNRKELAAENLALRQQLMIRDRDGIYGAFFQEQIKHMGIEQVPTAYRSPWQSPYVERLIGSIRRECLDHCIVLNERHLRRIVAEYLDYYHESRTHLSLSRNSPFARDVEPPGCGRVIAIPQVGGLHHRYVRAA